MRISNLWLGKNFAAKEPENLTWIFASHCVCAAAWANQITCGHFFPRGTNRKIYELLSDKEGALNIFVAGTVNGCIDLQNANFMKYHDLVVRFEGKGKSPGAAGGYRYYAISYSYLEATGKTV